MKRTFAGSGGGASGGVAAAPPPFRAGHYYGSGTFSAAFAFTNGTAHFTPFVVSRSSSFDRIGVNITVAGSVGAVVRMGIYADDGNGRPGALVAGSEVTTDGTLTGVREETIAVTLGAGVYWLCAAIQGAPATTPTISYTATSPIQISMATAANFFGFTTAAQGASTTILGALPANAPATGASTTGIRVGLRAA